MSQGWLTTALLVLLMTGAPTLAQPTPSTSTLPPKWGPHIDFEGKLGNERRIGEADVFYPIWQDSRSMLFGNVKARLDDNASSEGNYGLGIRHMLRSGWNVGTYGYFDRRRTEHANYFNQWTVGAEALSLDWDFRVNAYIPEGRRSHLVDSLSTATIEGTSVIFRGGEERSLRGFDIEAGWRVPVFKATAPRQVRVYGGGYRFYADGVNPVQGPRARVEMVVDEVPELWEGSRFAIGAEIQHDTPRGTTGFATVRLRIPLQVFGSGTPASRLTSMERRMTDPVVRDIDVVSQASALGAPETATAMNGAAITAISTASTSGAALPGAVAAAGNNSTVILSGTFNVTTTTTLQTGQTVMAGTIPVRSPSGRTALLVSPAAITSSANSTNLLNMGANSTLTGMTLNTTGTNSTAVVAGANNATISNNTLVGATGILVSNGTNVTISGNSITGTSGALEINAVTGAVSATASGNSLSGGNHHTVVSSGINPVTILAGSTGNVIVSGACSSNGATTTGSISYTNGTTCP